jgi:hypothetical protein
LTAKGGEGRGSLNKVLKESCIWNLLLANKVEGLYIDRLSVLLFCMYMSQFGRVTKCKYTYSRYHERMVSLLFHGLVLFLEFHIALDIGW